MAAISAAVPAVVLFPNSSGMGGMEAHLTQLARGLHERGIHVAAICEPRADTQLLRDGLRAAGAEVHELAARAAAGGVRRRIAALVDVLKRYPGCVVHMHYGGYGGGELVQLAARLAGVKAVVRTEHVPPVPPITRKGRLLVHVRDRFLARVICVSEANRRAHVEQLGRDRRKFVVVHNGIDLSVFAPGKVSGGVLAELGIPADSPVIGTVARLAEARKGVDHFLQMSKNVVQTHPDARFLVVGDGPLRPVLEDRALELGIANSVRFVGERSDVPQLLAAMRVFVMSSLYEAGPYTVIEALAMQRPVVSTPVGLVPEVIEDGVSGRLVPIGDIRSLTQAVLDLLNDPGQAAHLGAAGRERVRGYSLNAMVDQLVGVYRAALTSA